MKSISVIGCGSVGKTLCRLWVEHGVLEVKQILNRSRDSSLRAVQFVGSGEVVESVDEFQPVDFIMIGTADDAIEDWARKLGVAADWLEGRTVFHCSGVLSSEVLAMAAAKGARTGSVHPVMSFADPSRSIGEFRGTYCALEGDPEAKTELRMIFEAIGARVFDIYAESKVLYHSAAVFVSNYLVALMEVGLRCYEKAGIRRELALALMQPIVTATVGNLFRLGPVKALTGPIARGEIGVIRQECKALTETDEAAARLYSELGRIAVELSREQGNASEQSLEEILRILTGC